MSTENTTTGPWLTVPEIARRLTPDLELGTALHGAGTGLEAGQFTLTPAPFTRPAKQPEVTAQQVQDLVDETAIPKRPVGDPNFPRGYEYDYAAVRLELGLSAQAPTAARRVEDHPAEDPDAKPNDVSSLYKAALHANVTEDAIRALIASGAVRNWAEPLRMTSATGEVEDVPARPAVSIAEVRAAAEHGLGLGQ